MRFKVSIAQINPKSGDIEGNAETIIEAIQCGREAEADLVVLPEMCLTGYCLDEKLLINQQFLAQNTWTGEGQPFILLAQQRHQHHGGNDRHAQR